MFQPRRVFGLRGWGNRAKVNGACWACDKEGHRSWQCPGGPSEGGKGKGKSGSNGGGNRERNGRALLKDINIGSAPKGRGKDQKATGRAAMGLKVVQGGRLGHWVRRGRISTHCM